MKITMISNYINHHQIPFSNELYHMEGVEYHFIETIPMEEERIAMGWQVENKLPYVSSLNHEFNSCKTWIDESDILLVGWMEREDLIVNRLESDKLTIRISERIYREGQWKMISPRGLLKKYKEHIRFRKKSVYLLCAGGYVASDFALIHAYPNKKFQFGYFPEFISYDIKELFQKKKEVESCVEFVWAGRFLPLKHPEFVIRLAKRMKERNYKFHIHMIGSGEMEEMLYKQVKVDNLEKYVTFCGFLPPNKVRTIMEQSHIHLFTSNHLEGWGAVVNEAMNSGCACVVNRQVGAAPFLIQHSKNGLIYEKGRYAEFEKQVITLMEDKKKIKELGIGAYETIKNTWNEKCAAKELLRFYENWKKGCCNPPKEGPFSIAKVERM